MPQTELNCDDCGACCLHSSIPPFRYHEPGGRLGALPSELRTALDALRSDEIDSPCLWLDPDTLKCNHYEYRPEACREFELGSAGCHSVRKLHQIAAVG